MTKRKLKRRRKIIDLAEWLKLDEEFLKVVRAYIKDHGEECPTFEWLANKLAVTYSILEDLCEANEATDMVVGVGIDGGGGHYAFKTMGEYQVEIL